MNYRPSLIGWLVYRTGGILTTQVDWHCSDEDLLLQIKVLIQRAGQPANYNSLKEAYDDLAPDHSMKHVESFLRQNNIIP